MWVCLEGLRLADPSIFFSRDPKARRAWVGASFFKEELVVGLVVTPELWPIVSRVAYDRLGIHQHMGHRLKFDRTVVNALRS